MIFRFLYINIFAFLLAGLSVLIFLVPLDIFLIVFKIICVILPLVGSINIFSKWKAKNKKIQILVARNRKGIRLETFDHLGKTFCGRLMVDLALRDLRKYEPYSSFTKPEWKEIKNTVFDKKAKKQHKKRSSNTLFPK